jgi:hypothetical protein
MPSAESFRAKSARPVLSVTLRMARWTFGGVGDIVASNGIAALGNRKFYQEEKK